MKGNGLLKWLMIPMALLLVFVGIKVFSGSGSPRDHATTPKLTAEEAKALGIEGDTAQDTVATLVGHVKQLRLDLQGAMSETKEQRAENERLRLREGTIERRIDSALEAEKKKLQNDHEQMLNEREKTQELLQDLQRQLEGLGGQSGHADLPVGLGLEAGDAEGIETGVRWIEPEDARSEGKGRSNKAGSFSFPSSFSPAQKTLDNTREALAEPGRQIAREPVSGSKSRTRPVYTVPSNSTLIGAISMTALIGRVPIDGTVNDPYPFKVLVGPDNLTANGIDIPDVAGAVVSGTASGDWTLSCVRGQIRSITFVFHDGTIRTLPEDNERGSSRQPSSNLQDGLGWISDPHGIPCVSGDRRSNAQQYLGTQALITAAGAGAASLIKSDNGNVAVVAGNNGSLGTVGISGNEAMGRILAGGVQKMSQWVNRLYGQAFAAVYVKPGAPVAVHIEQSLTLDYDPQGRKVDHRLGGAQYAPNLD
nr:TIGR03752 family integrating conjugative element protein [Pseudomonas sp. FFPRI_1]